MWSDGLRMFSKSSGQGGGGQAQGVLAHSKASTCRGRWCDCHMGLGGAGWMPNEPWGCEVHLEVRDEGKPMLLLNQRIVAMRCFPA